MAVHRLLLGVGIGRGRPRPIASCCLRDGWDRNPVKRVASLASADEVLVTSTVKELVIGSQIEFEDRGSRVLKGVPGRWRLFAVTGR